MHFGAIQDVVLGAFLNKLSVGAHQQSDRVDLVLLP
jgi:hypothetical protein